MFARISLVKCVTFFRVVLFFVSAITTATTPVSAAGENLSEPVLEQSLETIERRVFAVGRAGSGLVIAPDRERFVITTIFNTDGKSRESVFGKMIENKRMNVGEESESFSWRAFFSIDKRVMAFEGTKLLLMEMDDRNFKEIIRRSIPWDKIKPARDRGGEPTSGEIAQYRAGFKKVMTKSEGIKISGMAELPDAWLKNGKTNYILLSRFAQFPLLLVECSKTTASQCMLTRGCNLEKFSGSKIEMLRGIGVSAARKQILLGDPAQKKLHILDFNSCYHVAQKSSKSLPRKIKTLTNLYIDRDDRLFVTTDAPDDYLNGSLYFWNKSQW